MNSPAANATFNAGDTITLTAGATDADGTVAKVEFFDGDTKLGEATAAPFTFDWAGASTGAHTITARATDNAGAVSVSGTLSITVNAPTPPGNAPPTVAITAPVNNFKANAPANVTLVANAGDSDGTVAKVEFFNGATKLGEDTTAPYQFNWAGVGSGNYTLTAKATDDKGATATSGTVQVIINALPTVTLTAPTAGTSIKAGTNVTLRATAGDSDGSISKVEFFLDGSATALGTGTRVGATTEYTLAWNNVPLGAHTIVARATDNDGATQSTASTAVNVAANALPTVTLDDPTAAANGPTNLVLSASASDSDGSIAKVEFFNNGATLLGTGTLGAGKYTLSVPVAAAGGSFVVTARATDNEGGQTTTASKSKTIAANVPPAVAITSASAFTLDAGNAPKTLTLTATASDSDGIAKVEFFNGATKIGEDSTAPYEVSWANVASGSYSITAKATDTAGSTTTTAAQAVTVTPNTSGMWATLNAAQKAGLALTPNKVIGDPGDDAGEVMTVIGINVLVPGYNAAISQAVRKAADLPLAATGGYVACPGGGAILVQAVSATESAITYGNGRDKANCIITGYAFAGGGDYTTVINGVEVPGYPHVRNIVPKPAVPPFTETVAIGAEVKYKQLAADRFSIELKSPKVDGPGTPAEDLEPYPRNAISYGYLECTVVGATRNCLTNFANSFFWGYDLSWTNWADNALVYPAANYATDDTYLLSGTLRICQPDPQLPDMTPTFCQSPATAPAARHLKFENMTNASGRAIVYGSNGWSVVTRLTAASPGVERVQVQQFIGGVAGTATNYRCPVNAQGFFACVVEP